MTPITPAEVPGPFPEPEKEEVYEPVLGRLGLAAARLVAGWQGENYTGPGSDSDDTENPLRANPADGSTPEGITFPHEPLTEADTTPTPSAPTPVTIVIARPVEVARPSKFVCGTPTVTGTPTRIIGQNPDRHAVIIENTSGSACYIAPTEEALQGDPSRKTLEAGSIITMTHTAEIWSSTDGASVILSITSELA